MIDSGLDHSIQINGSPSPKTAKDIKKLPLGTQETEVEGMINFDTVPEEGQDLLIEKQMTNSN